MHIDRMAPGEYCFKLPPGASITLLINSVFPLPIIRALHDGMKVDYYHLPAQHDDSRC